MALIKCSVGLDGVWLNVHPKFCEMLMYTEQELRELTFAGIVHTEDRKEGMIFLDNLEKEGNSEFESCMRFQKKTGEFIQCFVTMIAIRDKKGKAEYVTCIVENLSEQKVVRLKSEKTEQKRAETEFQKNELLFKSLFTYNPYPVMWVDLEGKIRDANYKIKGVTGLPPEELMGLDFFSFVTKQDLGRVGKHFTKAVAGEPQYYVVKTKTANGELETETSLSPIYIQKKIIGLFCTIKDITEEMKAKQALANSEQRWQRLTEQNPQPVQIIQDGKIVFINRAGAEYFGASSPEELIGNSVLNFSHPEFVERVKERKRRLEESTPVAPDAHKIILLNGEERYIEAHSIPISYHGRKAIQTVIHDITDLKEKQQIIEKSLKEKETLLQEIHHRVKNNLAVISALLELQVMKATEETAITALKDSQLRVQSMAMIHEKLYRTESLDRIAFNNYLMELVEAIKKTYNFSGKNIEVLFDLDDVSLDINQAIPCSLIINEVIINCYKHAFPGRNKGNVQVCLEHNYSEIKLLITDDGVGISKKINIEEQQSLGMTLISALCKQLDGTVEFKTGSNKKGTVFELNFEKNMTPI